MQVIDRSSFNQKEAKEHLSQWHTCKAIVVGYFHPGEGLLRGLAIAEGYSSVPNRSSGGLLADSTKRWVLRFR